MAVVEEDISNVVAGVADAIDQIIGGALEHDKAAIAADRRRPGAAVTIIVVGIERAAVTIALRAAEHAGCFLQGVRQRVVDIDLGRAGRVAGRKTRAADNGDLR
jgi:hypothetical protein